ncbi:MAG: exosome complex protein Rrp42 [Methanobacteriota archaeon]|nr:MAG: exosome complex protein Rrp42 [Euryarchaeota archaeon]
MLEIIADIKRDYIKRIVESGKRLDGRGPDDYREIKIERDLYKTAEGSALVSIGGTQVIAGVKMILGEPFPDMPNQGVLTTSAELIPMASPTFEAGPPKPPAIEVARVVDRGIRESGAIDTEKLCIVEGEKVWVVFLDLHVLDYDGNLFDASTLASISALLSAKMPKLEDDRVIYDERKDPLPVKEKPISTTYAKIGGTVVLDPSLEEEQVLDARLTLATVESGDLCAMQKGGSGAFTKEEVLNTIDRGIEKAKELRKLLKV